MITWDRLKREAMAWNLLISTLIKSLTSKHKGGGLVLLYILKDCQKHTNITLWHWHIPKSGMHIKEKKKTWERLCVCGIPLPLATQRKVTCNPLTSFAFVRLSCLKDAENKAAFIFGSMAEMHHGFNLVQSMLTGAQKLNSCEGQSQGSLTYNAVLGCFQAQAIS